MLMNSNLQLKALKNKKTQLYFSTKTKSIALERIKQKFHFEKLLEGPPFYHIIYPYHLIAES
jgi:hypothetical protein